VREKLRIEDSHHGGAGTRRGHNVIRIVKQVQNPCRYLARFTSESGVERRLTAARLARVESDLHTLAAQNLYGTLTHLREELVCQASDEERDTSLLRYHVTSQGLDDHRKRRSR
jgi:hypothetical protein